MTARGSERNHQVYLQHITTSDSLETIGEYYNITRERVRQIIRKERALLPTMSQLEQAGPGDRRLVSPRIVGHEIELLREKG